MADTPDEAASASLANTPLDTQRLDVYAVRHTVLDMTPLAATALVKAEEAKRDAAIAQANASVVVAKLQNEALIVKAKEEAAANIAIAKEERVATISVEEQRSAVPAKQATWRQLITAVVVAGGIVACALVPDAAPSIGAVVLVLGGTEITRTIVNRDRKKKDDE